MNAARKLEPMATLLDPYEIRSVAPAPVEISVEVEWDVEAFLEPDEPEGPRGVSALAWSRARGWTVED